MRWLLTTPADADLESVKREVEAVGGRLHSEEPVPLDADEQVLYADGPEDLHERLARSSAPIKANPDSEMGYYQGDIS